MMEEELRRADLMPTPEIPAVNIEAFLEIHLAVMLDQHAHLPDDILGLTEFYPERPPRVAINHDLTGSAMDDDDDSAPGLVGRWRATLAHEASHVVIHRPLFEVDRDQGSLFPCGEEAVRESRRLMRCKKANVLYRGTGADWREVQANRGMAALLMPGSVFLTVVKLLEGGSSPLPSNSVAALQLARELADRFQVSRQAAEIRLATLGVVGAPGQGALDI
jgi:hypothetical protein